MKVTVYSRSACTCCERALDVLRSRQSRHGFDLEWLDVDTDPDWKSRYGAIVPVVLIDGVERFKGQVNPVLLDRLLDASRTPHERPAAPGFAE